VSTGYGYPCPGYKLNFKK